MGTLFGTILAFTIVFGVLVFIHELGHYLMAKLVGVRVEVFSFGYGKRLFGFKKGETDYRVSLIPMGGYVKLLGEGLLEPGKELAPDDLMAKKRWEKFLVMVMGSVMNILLAIVLVGAINMVGVTVPEWQGQKPVIGRIDPGSPAEKASLQVDDEIISINKKSVKTWTDVEIAVSTKPDKVITLEIKRKGELIPVELKTEAVSRFYMGYAGFMGKILTQVMMVKADSPAKKGGLKARDVILAVNGEPVYFYQFIQAVEKNPGQELEFTVDRQGQILKLHVTPRREGKVGKVGILQGQKSILKKYGFLGAISQSVRENVKNVFLVVRLFKDLITGQASTRQLAGPLEIANISYAMFRLGFMALISWIAVISLQLGVINLFPIPVLDGGQIFVIILEGIFRKDFSPKVRQVWMQIGFVIFIFLIAFVILNDIARSLPNGWKSLVPF
jgi:regulator of sigma E protease